MNWYLDYFEKELKVASENNFTGALTFQVNFRGGTIGNMNMEVKQSIKEMEGDNNARKHNEYKEKR